jgi:hypothetical protein
MKSRHKLLISTSLVGGEATIEESERPRVINTALGKGNPSLL